jgi:hypothetical protein
VFVGRDRELADLDQVFAELPGRGITVHLHGAPGIGKSALLAHFLDDLHAGGQALVLAARCYERESVPFKAFDPVVDALARHLASLPAEQAAALVPPDAPLLARIFPVLMRVPAIAGASAVGLTGDPPELRRLAFGALHALLTRMARQRPLVVVIDDLQWGDADSAPLIDTLTRPPHAVPMLLVLSYRTEDRERSPLLRAIRRRTARLGPAAAARDLALGPLDGSPARRLARRLLREAGHDDALVDSVVAEARGSPLFLQEMARFAASQRPGAGGDPSLDGLLAARIGALDEGARRLLQAVSVAGADHPGGGRPRRRAQPGDVLAACHRLSAPSIRRASRRRRAVSRPHPRDRGGQASGGELAAHHRRLGLALSASPESAPRPGAALRAGGSSARRALRDQRRRGGGRGAASTGQPRCRRAIRMRSASAAGRRPVRRWRGLTSAGRSGQPRPSWPRRPRRRRWQPPLPVAGRRASAIGRRVDRVDALGRAARAPACGYPAQPARPGALVVARRPSATRHRIRARQPAGRAGRRDPHRPVLVGGRRAGHVPPHHRGALPDPTPAQALRWESRPPGARSPWRPSIPPCRAAPAGSASPRARRRPPTGRATRESKGWANAAVGLVAYQSGEWAQAFEHRAARSCLQRSRAVVGADHRRAVLGAALYYLGELRIARRVHRVVGEAEDRGDLYAVMPTSVDRPATRGWSAATSPGRARLEFDRRARSATTTCSTSGPTRQAHCDLWGDGESTWRRTVARWPDLKRSLFLRIVDPIEALRLRARAASGGTPRRHQPAAVLPGRSPGHRANPQGCRTAACRPPARRAGHGGWRPRARRG